MLITNFASGELSERLYGRADLQTYYQGASRLKNFNILPTGGIVRRNGFCRCGDMTSEARLIPFIVNKDLSYVIEMGTKVTEGIRHGYLAFWKNGNKVLNTEGSQLIIESTADVILPASIEHVREVQYVQDIDCLYFVHNEYKPLMLKWNAGDSFTLSVLQFDFEPDIKVIDEYGVYDPATDSDLPDPDTDTFQTEGNFPSVIAFFQNRLWLGGTKNAPQKVWVSAAPDEHGNRYTVFETYTHYVSVSQVVKDPDLHVFTCSGVKGTKTLTSVTQDFTGIEDITNYYVSGNGIAVGTKVVSVTANTITVDTALLDDLDSYTCTIQLWRYATTATADDYTYDIEKNDMTTPDSGFFFEMASDQNDAVKWICPGNNLVIGTESSEYVVPSGVNALTLQVVLNGRHSSDDIQALYVGEAVIFFAQGKHAIREYYWNAQEMAFQSNNITIANSEILEESPAIDFDYMNNPYGRLIITKADGNVAVLLYEKSAGILGWSRIEHGKGRILSCATVRSDNSSDTLYAAVQYEDGSVYMEELNLTAVNYLDSWDTYSEETAAGYSDDAVVFDGSNTYTKTEATNNDFTGVDNVIIGYRYESLIKSMPVVNNNITGAKRITDLQIRFSKSYLPEIVNPSGVTEKITGLTEPYSGIRKVIYPGSSETDVFFTIKTDRPYPCTVLSVNANLA